MPVEIGQLIINARIISDQNVDRGVGYESDQSNIGSKQEIIEHCIAEVLRILEQRQER